MERHNFKDEHTIVELVSEYEAMSQKGTVAFLEEKVFLQLIDYYHKEYLLDKALDVIEHALAQHRFSADFHIRKAQLLIESRKEDQAILSLEQAQIFAPSEIEIQLLRAEALCALKKYEEALLILESIKPEAQSHALSEIYLCEAQIYEYRHQFGAMFHALKNTLLTDPSNMEALKRMWICVELSQKHEDSVELHQKLVDIDPYSYHAWYNLGHAYSCLNDHDNAIMAFEYAFLINEQFQDAYRDCAAVCIEVQNYKKALRCYEDALEHFPPDSDILMNIGKCYYQLSDLEIAKAFFLKAIDMDSNNDEAHFHLGECFVKLGMNESSIDSYIKAIRIENRREEYFAGLAEVYFRLGELEKAKPLFRKATEIAPEQIIYWIQYASFLMESGENEEAIEILDEAEANIGNIALLYCRIACLFSMGRRQEAIYRLGEALNDNFALHTSLFDLAPYLQHDPDVQSVLMSFRDV